MGRAKLSGKLERLFSFLSSKDVGDTVTEQEILAATGWKPATLSTHRRKHALDPFLSFTPDDRYRVLRDGASISKGDIAEAFTQVRPGLLVLTKGMRITGVEGSYELVKYIGEGAVAHVWAAKKADDNTRLAIKVMNPRPDLLDPTRLENVRTRFQREARNGKNLDHPNIVAHRDIGDIKSHPFLVMDLADESLSNMLRQGPLSVSASLPIILSCVEGLKYLHGINCVHRDIKPPNILRFGSKFILGDLGIVRWPDMNPAFTSAATITQASVQLGSWYYMAPEQRRAPHKATPLSDVYALGISWFEMLTGNTLDPAEVGAKRFPEPSSNDNISQLIASMLDFVPSNRPSIGEIRNKLLELQSRI